MKKICVIGCGHHSRNFHLPSLARYQSEHPGTICLTAVCDLNLDRAQRQAEKYQNVNVYTSIETMLQKEQPHACVAITPIRITREISIRVMSAGIPLLMEKPLGSNLQEAREIAELSRTSMAPVMVSMNRRFDPGLTAALAWKGERSIQYIRATMVRHNRTEPEFYSGTALHAVDTLRKIGGDIRDIHTQITKTKNTSSFMVSTEFQSGLTGTLEIFPDAGMLEESYEIFGPDYRIRINHYCGSESGFWCWEGKDLAAHGEPSEKVPLFIRNGTYDETAEFIKALRENRNPSPSPEEVLQSSEICQRILT